MQFATMCNEKGLNPDKIFNQVRDRDSLGFYYKYLETVKRNLENRQDEFILNLEQKRQIFRLQYNEDIWFVKPVQTIELVVNDIGWYTVIDQSDISFLKNNELSSSSEIRIAEGTSGKRKLDETKLKIESKQIKIKVDELKQGWFDFEGRRINVAQISDDFPENPDLTYLGKKVEYESIDSSLQPRFKIFGVWNSDMISVNGTNYRCNIIKPFDISRDAIRYGEGYLIVSKNRPDYDCVERYTSKILKEFNLSELFIDDKSLQDYDAQYVDNQIEILGNNLLNEYPLKWDRCPNWNLKLIRESNNNRFIYKIKEKDLGKDETGTDPRMNLYEDNAILKIGKQKVYPMVDRGLRDSFSICLKEDERSRFSHNFGYTIKVTLTFDTRDIRNQMDAIQRLEKAPFIESIGLIKLFLPKNNDLWDNYDIVHELPTGDWQVLKKESFEGTKEQRAFVKKALSTPEYAILDGPPGTGKTTAIRELVIQLVMSGKKVLVASSTNAAINNLMERLITKDFEDVPDFKERANLLRLGREEKAEQFKEYSMEYLVKEYTEKYNLTEDEAKRILIESSNVICGTISIVNRELVRDYNPHNNDYRYNLINGGPIFDYMIMDESSKTTVPEFIVPAIISKRWILAGDVRQLSPFTERTQVVDNLHDMTSLINDGRDFEFNDAHKDAVLWLHYGRIWLKQKDGIDRFNNNNVIIPVNSAVSSKIASEIRSRTNDEELKKTVDGIYCIDNIVDFDAFDRIYRSNIVFVNGTYVKNWTYRNKLPVGYLLINEGCDTSPELFACKYLKNNNDSLSKDYLRMINEDKDQKWDEEIVWRLDRVYWLRNIKSRNNKNAVTNYLSTIYNLFPYPFVKKDRSEPMKKIIFRILNAVYPSILEMITGNISRENNQMRRFSNDDSIGLISDNALSQRRESLVHQHRMHPNISRTPSSLFYDDIKGGLKDGSELKDRDWRYYLKGYDHWSNVWINCEYDDYKNKNKAEANKIYSLLNDFILWAEKHPQKINEKIVPYDVIILTFYTAQMKMLEETVTERLLNDKREQSFIHYRNVNIKISTVDYIQGQEADIVFLSMVRKKKIGFMDTPNRLNVGITRAKHLMVYVGNYSSFTGDRSTHELRTIAHNAWGDHR